MVDRAQHDHGMPLRPDRTARQDRHARVASDRRGRHRRSRGHAYVPNDDQVPAGLPRRATGERRGAICDRDGQLYTWAQLYLTRGDAYLMSFTTLSSTADADHVVWGSLTGSVVVAHLAPP